jgi:putative membrane protein
MPVARGTQDLPWWPATAGVLFAAAWLIAAWRPLFPQDWALENVLSLLAAWWLVRRHRRAPLSAASYLFLLVFGIAHEIGSHTYSEVPYRAWLGPLFDGGSAGRNHYDRLVHFLFGLLCYRPLKEVMASALPGTGAAARILPVCVVATISLVYELVEWCAAMLFGAELGQAYLGTQGDEWDAQKDSGLALAGAGLAAAIGWVGPRLSAVRWPCRSRAPLGGRCASPPGSCPD